MKVYISRVGDNYIVTSEIFSNDVSRVSTRQSMKVVDFGDGFEKLLNVVVWFNNDTTVSFDDCIDIEVE